MGIIRDLIQNVKASLIECCNGDNEPPVRRDPEAAEAGGLPTATQVNEREALSYGRHELVEDFMQRRGRILPWLPLILVLAIATTNIYAAVWSAFGVSLFLNLLDFYRSRYNPKVSFPMILNLSSLCGYTTVVIIAYEVANFNPVYIGPIVVSFMWGGIALSMIIQYPMTIQTSGPTVDEATRKSPGFLKLNQILTGYVLFWFSIMLICIWCSTLYAKNTAGQIILGIVIPIIVPLFIFVTVKPFANYVISKYGPASKEKKNEEEQNLLEKQ